MVRVIMIKKLIRKLMINKDRKYKLEFFFTGLMGNRFSAGTFEFSVSDKDADHFGGPSNYFLAESKGVLGGLTVVRAGEHVYYNTLDRIKYPVGNS